MPYGTLATPPAQALIDLRTTPDPIPRPGVAAHPVRTTGQLAPSHLDRLVSPLPASGPRSLSLVSIARYTLLPCPSNASFGNKKSLAAPRLETRGATPVHRVHARKLVGEVCVGGEGVVCFC